MKIRWTMLMVSPLLLAVMGINECEGGGEGNGMHTVSIPAATQDYVVFSWNDLGMHCLNPTYDEAVILPPYNTVWAQVVKRGNPPKIVTTGLTVEYSILNNTYSAGKKDAFGADFGQFWTYDQALFGVDVPLNYGLNLEDPSVSNTLYGSMVAKGDHFQVNGIPIVPVDDSGVWNPYQEGIITVKDTTGKVLASTHTTVPTSDEINCAECHSMGGSANDSIQGGTASVFANILAVHDAAEGTDLVNSKPVLCASCHGSPALGTSGPGSAGLYLSQAVHGKHATVGATCYSCHPGESTKCSRSQAHSDAEGNCTSCHGDMAQVSSSISNGRIPWQDEPKCASCHNGVQGVDTGNTLYRNATGHGGAYCASCHGSPHAQYPSTLALDNYQPQHYQNSSLSMGSCATCHPSSKGEGAGEFADKHGGSDENSACNVCHTAISGASNTNNWPHAFTWKDR